MKYHPAYASHLPILIKIMGISKGKVLELGMGPFSTPVLHWLCLDRKRQLFSYDNNPEYFKSNKNFETKLHRIHFVKNWDKIDINNTHWGVVFIDHSPAERRVVDVKRLANNADYIIIHDSEKSSEHAYHYEDIYPLFKYRYNYRRQKPYTTVLSNFKDILNGNT